LLFLPLGKKNVLGTHYLYAISDFVDTTWGISNGPADVDGSKY